MNKFGMAPGDACFRKTKSPSPRFFFKKPCGSGSVQGRSKVPIPRQSCKILAVIPARAGSRGIPGKNLKRLAGLPLIAWTIREAKKSRLIDRVIVSTEDIKIAAVARKHGAEVPFLRPRKFSRDHVPGVIPVLHAIGKIPGYDAVLCLQPTSPFRSCADINAFIRFSLQQKASSAASVSPVSKHPAWTFHFSPRQRLVAFLPQTKLVGIRQKLRPAWALNGALYFARIPWLLKKKVLVSAETYGFPLPKERALDLDSPEDWVRAARLAGKRRGSKRRAK